jgi:CBS-domain-containing membrane protein
MRESVFVALERTLLTLGTISLFVFVYGRILESPILLAAFASSVFTVFGHPESKMASTKAVVGGQMIGAITGYGVSLVIPGFTPLSAGVAVATATLFMILLGVQHPPAAGTSMSFVYNAGGVSTTSNFWMAIVVILSLSLLKIIFRVGDWLLHSTEKKWANLHKWFGEKAH